MQLPELSAECHEALEKVLGYVNFSSGAEDPRMHANLNLVFNRVLEDGGTWRDVGRLLEMKLAELADGSPAFQDSDQAKSALAIVFPHVLDGYLDYHRDLLFHQTADDMYGAFFVGRVFEAVLHQGGPWDEADRITQGAIKRLNDYIGYRPVAALESQKLEPYPHEFIRPVPLYIRGAGVVAGPYRAVVQRAMKLLEDTSDELLRSAWFDPNLMDELAYDPRAYDFDHPAHRRPNHHFGQWDFHHLDNQGRYRRFVVQQVTLDALMSRLNDDTLPPDEVEFEAAAVLAGVVLMASGICGQGPDTHDSETTLVTLLGHIAGYRDDFYESLFAQMQGEHGRRLQAEAAELRQPFGGARQHLNAQLARQRASQLEHVQLARLYARMGFAAAATRQVDVVPAASARMMCRIDCWMTEANLALDRGQLDSVVDLPAKILDMIRRAIQCGAAVDPWNILGFDAQFSLFHNVENSGPDHRVDELIDLVERLFALYSRIWSDAATVDADETCRRVSREFKETATWWYQFAAHEVSGIEACNSMDAYHAAEHVANALQLWHQGGAEAGNIRFWATHAEMFDSPKGYALVIDALLERQDYVASRALLTHWLDHSLHIPLEHPGVSFAALAERWMLQLRAKFLAGDEPSDTVRPWVRIGKFFDYMEANAGDNWEVPTFRLADESARPKPKSMDDLFSAGPDDELDDDDENLFGAAYENVVYHDSTDDGIDGSVFETSDGSEDELQFESEQIEFRLVFLGCIARLWKLTAVSLNAANRSRGDGQDEDNPRDDDQDRQECLGKVSHWITQVEKNRRGLLELIDTVSTYRIASPGPGMESVAEFDRRCTIKESLLDQIIAATVEMANTRRLLTATLRAHELTTEDEFDDLTADWGSEERTAVRLLAELLRGNTAEVRRRMPEMLLEYSRRPLLYVPLAKAGQPRDIVAARVRQESIKDFLAWLPRAGMLVETGQLIETARRMERKHPVGPGAVTEFDGLFKIGYRAMVDAVARTEYDDSAEADEHLVACVEQLSEAMLISWLTHSGTLRLSALERVSQDNERWHSLVDFIQKYGDEMFTQRFMYPSNIRGIMHQGTDAWLLQLEERSDVEWRLLDDLDDKISYQEAEEHLTLILESIMENYAEYRDYNSTTTQSDRGGMLYTLLDFLRLRSRYDQVCWKLKPVVMAHEILLRHGRIGAAEMWRRALSEKVGSEADQYLVELAKLQKKYAMRMPTVADRFSERFVRPMEIDRMRALVEAALREAKSGTDEHPVFDELERSAAAMTAEPTGVGLDIPLWLVALGDEVERAYRMEFDCDFDEELNSAFSPLPLTSEQLSAQLDALSEETTRRQADRRKKRRSRD